MSDFNVKISLLIIISACEPPPPSKIERITSDLAIFSHANAAYLEKSVFIAASNASVYISTPSSSCSGTWIKHKGVSLILTNHHCFREKDLPCEGTKAVFSMESRPRTHKCQVGSLRYHKKADLVSFRLVGKVPYEPISIWEGKLSSPQEAFVIHHPQVYRASAGKLGGYQKVITGLDCYALGSFNLWFWRIFPLFIYGLSHSCNIHSGSSGSGLFDSKTGKLLGVVWGDAMVGDKRKIKQYAVAIHYKYVRKFLNNQPIVPPWWWPWK